MKIAFIADTHFGCRKNSQYFMDQQKEFFDECFFPYIIHNNIKTIFHFGDFFDNRKTVNFDTLRHSKDCFIKPIIANNMDLHMIVGNHDSYYKSNGELTSTKLLFDDTDNINVYDTCTALKFGQKSFLMVPWIFPIQKEEISNLIRTSTVDVICGHFEMIGVVYQGNTVSRKGMSTDLFSHCSHVFSGHYHKKSQYYIGSPYQMNWADYDDSKRIIVYDTETNEAESVYLSNDIYHKIEYTGEDLPEYPNYKNKIVRVLVKSKDDPAHFNKFIEDLDKHDPQEVDIKEEYLYIDIMEEDDLDDDTDTLGILLSSIDGIDDLSAGDKVVVKDIMKKLYDKAGE